MSGDIVNVMMKIQYSNIEKLEINQENEKARDYTIQSLASCIKERPFVGQNIEKDEIQQMFNKAF